MKIICNNLRRIFQFIFFLTLILTENAKFPQDAHIHVCTNTPACTHTQVDTQQQGLPQLENNNSSHCLPLTYKTIMWESLSFEFGPALNVHKWSF